MNVLEEVRSAARRHTRAAQEYCRSDQEESASLARLQDRLEGEDLDLGGRVREDQLAAAPGLAPLAPRRAAGLKGPLGSASSSPLVRRIAGLTCGSASLDSCRS